MFTEIYTENYKNIHEKAFDFNIERLLPSDWVEKNIYLTSAESSNTGYLKYDLTPYFREIVDFFDRDNPKQQGAMMTCAQIGKTTSVLVPSICHTIAEDPCNIMFLSGSEKIVRDTMRDRLDPVLKNSKLDHLITPTIVKKKNQRSGDTDFKKEFAGGSLTASTYNPRLLRFYTVQRIYADEFDDAPRVDKQQGSIRDLLINRTASFGASKKIMYSSTPTIKGASNIEEVFLEGDQRKWHWNCPHCKDYIPIEWSVKRENGTFAGLKWKLTDTNEIIRESIHYECQNCGGKIYEKDKFSLNLKGKFIPTAKPKNPFCVSWQLNALVLKPGADDWYILIDGWLGANPPGEVTDTNKLKVFLNTKLGQLWEDKGRQVKVTDLMQNTRSYQCGVVPDKIMEIDETGNVAILVLVCDLGGVMDFDNKIFDVRLDWEIKAFTTKGQTYSIDHGSIGTFQRTRSKNKNKDEERELYTYEIGQKNNVWDLLEQIRKKPIKSQSGEEYMIELTLVDTGNFTNFANKYIELVNDNYVVGIKGRADEYTRRDTDYRKKTSDVQIVRKSKEHRKLYIIETDDAKDILSNNMILKKSIDNFYPSGFMNFPQPEFGKYNYNTYFHHFESETRIPIEKDGVEVGFKWKKKHSSVENHFFDVNVYSVVAHNIFIDIVKSYGGEWKNTTWESFCNGVDSLKLSKQ